MSDAAPGTTAPAPGTTPPASPGPPAPAPAPATKWFDGIGPEDRGWAETKGWLIDDPKAAFSKAVQAHRMAQERLGVPSEELIRIPKPNAAEADVKAFWGKVGVPAEPKDYDLSSVKFTDGSALDQGFSDSIRGLLHAARVPADRAAGIVAGLVKIEEAESAAEAAEVTAKAQAAQQRINTNWGSNKDFNMGIARLALEKLGTMANLTAEQTKAGWDALSKIGGIDAAYALEMLLAVGKGGLVEAPFITGGRPGEGGPLSREAAKAEIEALKKDKDWFQRWQRGDRTERQKWENLHKIAYGQAA